MISLLVSLTTSVAWGLLGDVPHSYDAIIVTFVVVELIRVGVYECRRSPHSCDVEWLKVGVASHRIFGSALGNELLLN